MSELQQLLNLSDTLQNAFGCPVCLISYIKSKKIFQCSNGHDICESCKNKVEKCPQCRALFAGARNYGLEKVIEELENFKIQKKVKKNVEETPKEFGPQNCKNNIFAGPKQGKGLFKCRFENCKESEPICRMLNHVRTFHNSHLIEVGKEEYNEQYVHKFDTRMESLSRIYQIPKFGLFFLTIQIKYDKVKEVTNLYAWLQTAAPIGYAKTVRYSIDMTIENQNEISKCMFNDIPHTVRVSPEKIQQNGNCLKIACDHANSSKFIAVVLKIKQNKGKRHHLTNLNQKVKRTNKN